jgi:hypothetical protein
MLLVSHACNLQTQEMLFGLVLLVSHMYSWWYDVTCTYLIDFLMDTNEQQLQIIPID